MFDATPLHPAARLRSTSALVAVFVALASVPGATRAQDITITGPAETSVIGDQTANDSIIIDDGITGGADDLDVDANATFTVNDDGSGGAEIRIEDDNGGNNANVHVETGVTWTLEDANETEVLLVIERETNPSATTSPSLLISDGATVTSSDDLIIDNSGLLTVDGSLFSTTVDVNTGDGQIIINDTGTVTGQLNINNNATGTSEGVIGDVTVTDDGSGTIANFDMLGGTATSITNDGGTIDLTGGAQVTGNTVIDGGTVTVGDGATAGTLGDNPAADTVTVNAGGILDVTSTGVVNGTTGINGTGSVTNAGDMDAVNVNDADSEFSQTAGSSTAVTNDGGTVSITGGSLTSLANTGGTSTVNGADVTITNGVDVSAGEINIISTLTPGGVGGTSVVSGTGTLDIDGGSVGAINATGGTLEVDGGLIGAITNSGATASLSAGAVAALTNSGTGNTTIDGSTVAGGIDVQGGTVTVSGTGVVNGGATVSGGTLNVNATGDVNGTVEVTADGVVETTSGTLDTVTVDVTDDAAVDVTLGGGGATSLTLTEGDVVLTGTANITNLTLNGGDFVNQSGALDTGPAGASQLDVASGASFDNQGTVADNLVGAGDISNSGTAQNVVSQSGGSFTQTAGSSGIVTIENGSTGAISGGSVTTLNTAGGTTVEGAATSITTANISGGTFLLEDGSIGSLTNSGSSNADLNGGTVGSIDATGGTTEIGGATVTGNVDIEDATVRITSGQIDGDVTVGDPLDDADGASTATFIQNGSVDVGSVTVNDDGFYDLRNGTVGDVQVDGGTAELDGDEVASLTQTAGSTTLGGGVEVTGATDIDGGTVTMQNSTLTGAVDVGNGATLQGNAGDVDGELTIEDGGIVNANGTDFADVIIDADVANGGGAFNVLADTDAEDITVDGTLDFGGAGVTLTAETLDLGATGTVSNTGGGAQTIELNSTFTLDGGTIDGGAGQITVDSDGVNLLQEGTVTGTVIFLGDIDTSIDLAFSTPDAISGDLTVTDPDDGSGSTADDPTVTISAAQDLDNGANDFTITNDGATVIVTGAGSITNGGAIENNAGGTMSLGGNVTATSLTNTGTENADPVADSQLTIASGVTVTLTGASVTADFTNSAAADASIAGTLAGDVTNTGSGSSLFVASTGQITGSVLNEDSGLFTLSGGTVTGTLTNDATASVTGTINGEITNEDDGFLTFFSGTTTAPSGVVNESGGEITVFFDADVNGGFENENGGTITSFGEIGALTNDGVFNAGADAGPLNTPQISGTLDNEDDGVVNVGNNDTLTVTGLITNDGTLNVDGTLDADAGITNNDQIDLSGTILGDITNEGTIETDDPASTIAGTVTNAEDNGLIEVSGGEILVINVGSIINESGATVNILSGGQIVGDVTNEVGGDLDIDGILGEFGNLASVTNEGLTDLDGIIRGDLTNSGADAETTVGSASQVTGLVTNEAGATLDIDANFSVGDMDVTGGVVEVADGVTLTATTGQIEVQTGTALAPGIALEGDATFVGNVTNGGVIGFASSAPVADNTVTINGDTVNTGSFSLVDDATGDILVINGDVGSSTFVLDIDLSADGSADVVDVNGGTISGNIVLSMSETTASGAEELNNPITVLTYDGSSLAGATVSAIGLPTDGAVIYGLVDTGTAFQVDAAQNPAIGGIAGGFALTQSLVGTVINRPSTPFVSGLALPGDDPCGYGTWGRFVGGQADANGSVDTGSFGSFDGSISAEFYGAQAGFDYSCFDGTFNGFDLSFGGILGVNTGSTTQPVFNVEAEAGGLVLGDLNSTNFTDFNQTYAGVYVVGARDRLTFDLQYRVERADFDFRNEPVPGLPAEEELGIPEQTVATQGQTLSGSVAYSFPINEDLGISVIPAAGFSIGQTQIDDFVLEDGGRIEIDDAVTQVAYVGATIARTQIVGDTSAINYFGTLTYYGDFSSGVGSTVFVDAADTTGTESTAAPLGDFGELSLGLSYIRIYTQNELGPTRQLTASVRVDGRFSDDLESYGVTGQVRFQF